MGPRIRSAFDAASTAADVVRGLDLTGRTALVTGGGSGIGQEITRALAGAGARVIIGDVDDEKSTAAAEEIGRHSGAAVTARHLDLASLNSVREFAAAQLDEAPRLDILINNAGVMAPPLARTREGHELQLGINYLGHFLLTRLLEPALIAAGGARVVSVSSIGHRRSDFNFDDPDYRTRPYDRWEAYGQSKTGCALLAVALTARLGRRGVTANAVNPGGSMTGLQRYLTDDELRAQGWIDSEGHINARWRTPAQCAATSVWVATAPELAGIGGRYFENCAEAEPWRPEQPMKGVRDYALSPANAARLWEHSERLVEASPNRGED